MKRTLAATAFLLVALFILLPVAHAFAAPDVNSRISMAADWISAQLVLKSVYPGFARGTAPPWNSTIYTEDQALVALALSDYHATHYDSRYDTMLNTAMSFLQAARINGIDFPEYYDASSGLWYHVGGLSPSAAYATSALAAAIYKLVSINPSLTVKYGPVIALLEQLLNSYRSDHRDDGAWLFKTAGTIEHIALTRENAMMLAGILYIALYESTWGSKDRASSLALLAQQTARWLLSTQQVSPGSLFGGFPHSDSNSTQVSEENGEIMYGVDTYYTIIGVLLSNPSPSVFDARSVMGNWIEGFVVKMMDPFGGMYLGRYNETVIKYPKTARAAAWVMQALADIWIDIGDIGQGNISYRDITQATYNWTIGSNELKTDMQQALGMKGATGGFYDSIQTTGVDTTATLDVAASALYAFNRAAYIQIPEFPNGLTILLTTTVAIGSILKRVKRN